MSKTISSLLKSALFLVIAISPLASAAADTFQSNGATIDFEITGTGKPVFILHGGLASREDLRALINHLSKTHKVVALDTRGHGKSTGADQPISYMLMASDVNNLATRLSLTDLTVIGQSDGGITALTVALNYPNIVKQLIVLGANFNHAALPESGKNYLRNFKVPKEFDRAQFPGMYLDDYFAGGRTIQNYQRWFDKLAIMWTTSPNYSTVDIAQIIVPVLVINGDRQDIPLAHAVTLYNALPNAQLLIVPGATHFLQHEKPEMLHRAISEFLAP